jgi:hypothetical protein
MQLAEERTETGGRMRRDAISHCRGVRVEVSVSVVACSGIFEAVCPKVRIRFAGGLPEPTSARSSHKKSHRTPPPAVAEAQTPQRSFTLADFLANLPNTYELRLAHFRWPDDRAAVHIVIQPSSDRQRPWRR